MFDICPVCNSKAVIFDAVTGETLCSSCGIVLRNNLDDHIQRLERDSEIQSG